jgi:hypothetical protein
VVANRDAYLHTDSLADCDGVADANWNSDGGAVSLDRSSYLGNTQLNHVKVFVLPTFDTHSAGRFQATWTDSGHFSWSSWHAAF